MEQPGRGISCLLAAGCCAWGWRGDVAAVSTHRFIAPYRFYLSYIRKVCFRRRKWTEYPLWRGGRCVRRVIHLAFRRSILYVIHFAQPACDVVVL